MSYNLTTMQSIYHGQDEIVEITYNNSSVYHKSSGPDYTEPFYVENIASYNNILTIQQSSSSAPVLTIEYSTDKTAWNTLCTTSTTPFYKPMDPGDKIYLRCNVEKWASSGSALNNIIGVSKIGGNIMSLLYGSNFTGNETSFPNASTQNVFAGIFKSNITLIDASDLLLPANTLLRTCYYNMFSDCKSLTTAPELPATTLADYCYYNMFSDCKSLTTAPALPATTLAPNCYGIMFTGCKSLTTAPALPATTLVSNCYSQMFQGCTALTTLPALQATTLASSCCNSMFMGCTALTTLPALQATTLVSNCYNQMFYNCTSLNNVECLATDISASGATSNWLGNVSATGTFTKASGVTWSSGVSGIPSGWTVIEV